MIGQYEYEKITTFILLKRPIDELPFEVTEEVKLAWNSLKIQIEEIHANGGVVEIVSEMLNFDVTKE